MADVKVKDGIIYVWTSERREYVTEFQAMELIGKLKQAIAKVKSNVKHDLQGK